MPASVQPLRAKLLSLRSPEIDISNEYPPDPECFVILLEAEVGAEGVLGSEVFRIHACTPQWLSMRLVGGGEAWGHGLLIVPDWDGEKIRLAVAALCARTAGASWRDIGLKLSRFTEWEFENHSEFRAKS